jgi:hypothetical protein
MYRGAHDKALPGVVLRSDRMDAPISSIAARSELTPYAVPSPIKDRTSAMSYSATEAESIAALWSSLGPLLRKVSTAACDSQRSKMLMRPDSSRSALMAKSRHPAVRHPT